jgi:hypothetical protein
MDPVLDFHGNPLEVGDVVIWAGSGRGMGSLHEGYIVEMKSVIKEKPSRLDFHVLVKTPHTHIKVKYISGRYAILAPNDPIEVPWDSNWYWTPSRFLRQDISQQRFMANQQKAWDAIPREER